MAELGSLQQMRMTTLSQTDDTALILPHYRSALRTTLSRVSWWDNFTCSVFHVQEQGHSLPAQAGTVQGLVLLVPPELDWISIRGTRENSDHVGNEGEGSVSSDSLSLQNYRSGLGVRHNM